jgi:bifunctional UDP-N-acetylglucosamine pyrophosphorylase/glucosamine-1-phosphate N-acetyltransferase
LLKVAAVILAAGQGTRMKSDLPKVLHTIQGRPMVAFVIDAVKAAGADKVLVVVGHRAELVREACGGDGVQFVLQEQQLGTGHAVLQCEPALGGFEGSVLVLNGDVPCLSADTIRRFVDFHANEGSTATVLTTVMDDATGYGRIVRGDDGSLSAIVEHKDATPEQRGIREVNSGLFCFDSGALFSTLKRTGRANVQNEYYLTDVIALLKEQGEAVAAWTVDDSREVAGVNDVDELETVRRYIEERSG